MTSSSSSLFQMFSLRGGYHPVQNNDNEDNNEIIDLDRLEMVTEDIERNIDHEILDLGRLDSVTEDHLKPSTLEHTMNSFASSSSTTTTAAATSADSSTMDFKSPVVASTTRSSCSTMTVVSSFLSLFSSFGKLYARFLVTYPIFTKSFTAGLIFALSDYTAQMMELRDTTRTTDANPSFSPTSDQTLNWTRTFTSGAVGLLYFGPAAHFWYQMIFQLFPQTTLLSTLKKATLGQCIFGPSFTCVFFATSLLQSNSFTLKNWMLKIKKDLFTAWLAGLGFWPFVDLISYSLIQPNWIPLFINFCSFVWTIYLSLVANRK